MVINIRKDTNSTKESVEALTQIVHELGSITLMDIDGAYSISVSINPIKKDPVEKI